MAKELRAKVKAIVLVMLLTCSCICALWALQGCGGQETEASGGKGVLHVGVETNTVGFSYYNEKTGNYTGYEIDIANELAKRLGYDSVDFVGVATTDRDDVLINGEVDCLIACYSISEYRRELVDLSEPYYQCNGVVMVENSSLISSVEDLQGLIIGSQEGADNQPRFVEKLVEMGLSNGEVVSEADGGATYYYDFFTSIQEKTYEQLSDDLEAGSIGALLIDESVAYTLMNEDRSVLDFVSSTANYGVATQKGSDLSTPINEAIIAMREDGTLDYYLDKWDLGGDRDELWTQA